MTFEKALEAMKHGKEAMRRFWAHNSDAVVGVDTDSNGEKRLYIRHLDDPCKEKHYCHFGSSDAMADDWVIYEQEKKVEPDAFDNLRCDIKPMSYAEWKEAHIDAREYKKRIAELEAENAELKKRLANSVKPVYNYTCEFNPDAFKSVNISSGKALDDLWFVKANQHTEEYAKQIKEKLFEAYKLEPYKDETTMYTDLEITFKSGETITYSKGEWDDYSYDGKAVAVKKDGAWVGLYNFDNVFCVELKSRED